MTAEQTQPRSYPRATPGRSERGEAQAGIGSAVAAVLGNGSGPALAPIATAAWRGASVRGSKPLPGAVSGRQWAAGRKWVRMHAGAKRSHRMGGSRLGISCPCGGRCVGYGARFSRAGVRANEATPGGVARATGCHAMERGATGCDAVQQRTPGAANEPTRRSGRDGGGEVRRWKMEEGAAPLVLGSVT